MPLIFKTNHVAARSTLSLLNTCEDYLDDVTSGTKSTTTRANINVLGTEGVKGVINTLLS